MPARIFDDISVCKLRGKYNLYKYSQERDLRLSYERETDINFGEKKTLEIYFNFGDWAKIIGVPDGLISNLAIEFTITRSEDFPRYLLMRSVIYSYMCMQDHIICSTLIVPTTPPIFEDQPLFGYLVIPNGRVLDYIADQLQRIVNGRVEGRRNKFCPSCIYKRICPEWM
ncbi:hypothetical protein [Sulfolobus acidocaldarius]|uniref:CRISPR-associated protein Cas4 n=2 Tax=Sulfolobus acidocaldarius TaxID=2285 RepID=Q4J7P7_SULAC|nr:hypothetical protein [Sulfolobus acidocaldarius]AAY81185.1 hypothetical protein Saci_1880 [Sulfolobus acidocaldarius DSM 639]ALU30003.1 hypothetical protein ATY89_08700 [Sulfolobus acidocaldarius]ALU30693.1 hypothetical protein ATZ20_00110 [Sulfolobus acidocaldarius]